MMIALAGAVHDVAASGHGPGAFGYTPRMIFALAYFEGIRRNRAYSAALAIGRVAHHGDAKQAKALADDLSRSGES